MPDPDVLDRLFGELAAADVPVPAPGSVTARGRQRRRRARARTVAAAVAVAALVVGATQLPRLHEAPAAAGRHTKQIVCAAAPNAALTAELRLALPASQQQGVSVIALSPSHAVLYVLTTTAGFHGIAAESVTTGEISQNITPIGLPPVDDAATGGLGPDGDLAVTLSVSITADGGPGTSTVLVFSPTTIAWSHPSARAAVLEAGGQAAEALSAPVFAGPAHQFVAWESAAPIAGSALDSAREILEANLLTGVTAVVARGYVGAPVFVGGDLVWPVASTATGPTHLVAVSASAFSARQRVAVPLPLRKAGSATVIASSGGATVYASADLTKLFYAPSLSQPARQVLRLPLGSYLVPGGLAVGKGYLAWNTSTAASYVASAKSLAATRITDGTASWGAVQGVGGDVLASRSAQPKSGPRSLYLLSGSAIDGLTCARPGRAPA